MPGRPDDLARNSVGVQVELIVDEDIRHDAAQVFCFLPMNHDLCARCLYDISEAADMVGVGVGDKNQADVCQADPAAFQKVGNRGQLARSAGVDQDMLLSPPEQERIHDPEAERQQASLTVIHGQMLPAGTGQGQGSPRIPG
jgi:hypothetical protein